MLTGDSIASLFQIINGPYYDWHPIAYTLFVQLFTFNGQFIWLVSIVQSLLFGISVYFFTRSCFVNISRLKAIWITGILQATPFVGGLAVTMWKDIPYTSFLLLGLGVLIRTEVPSRLTYFAGGVFLVLSSVFRHEAPYVLFLLATTYLIVRLKKPNKVHLKLVSTFFIAGLISLHMSSFLVDVTKAIPGPAFTKTLALQRDLAALAHESPKSVPENTYKELKAISSEWGWERSTDCWTPIDYINPTHFNYEKANKFSEVAVSAWLEVATSKSLPKLLLWHRCFVKPFIPFPLQLTPDPIVISWLSPGVSSNTLGMTSEPKLSFFQPLMSEYVEFWMSIAKYASWPGLHFSLIIFFLVYALRKKFIFTHTFKVLISFVIGRQILLLILTPSYDARYGMQTTLLSVLFFLFIFWKICMEISTSLGKRIKNHRNQSRNQNLTPGQD
jgi:hypothetical protein